MEMKTVQKQIHAYIHTDFLQRCQGNSVQKRFYSTISAGATGYPNAKNACGPQLLPYAQTKTKITPLNVNPKTIEL